MRRGEGLGSSLFIKFKKNSLDHTVYFYSFIYFFESLISDTARRVWESQKEKKKKEEEKKIFIRYRSSLVSFYYCTAF